MKITFQISKETKAVALKTDFSPLILQVSLSVHPGVVSGSPAATSPGAAVHYVNF